MPIRRGRASAAGRSYSLIAIVSGSMLAILFVPNSQKNGTPLELTTMPYGFDRGVGDVASFISPVFGFSRATMLAPCSVNQRVPFWSKIGVCGSRAAGSAVGYSVTSPVFGSSLPTYPLKLPVNQMLPSLSAVRPWGPEAGVLVLYSFIAPVVGSRRPITLANWPVHQIAPSGVASGSCGREPRLGTIHSLILTCAGPAITTARGRGLSGKFLAR